ncbi:MAG: DUF456 family protein, partial [Thermoguttaceae bacterium]|nr:DUF456 family protein [Thermoguttaceae bacterium]
PSGAARAIFYAVILLLVLGVCWAATFFGLPGNWLMLLAAGIYFIFAPAEGPTIIGWPVLVVLAVLAVLGELLELLAAMFGASRAGASRRGAAMALIGSLIGAIVGAVVGVPVPIVGPIVAALLFASLGAMAGAIVGERRGGRAMGEIWRIGKAAFWGRLFGTLAKVGTGAVMIAVTALALMLQ